SLAGFVYADVSPKGYNDGIKQPDEAGIAGVTVTLDGKDDTGAAVHQAVQTGADGAYKFDQLRPGTYTLTESQPAGWLHGQETVGTPGGTAASHQIPDIHLPPGVDGRDNNFGELRLGELSGRVFADTSPTGFNNGVQDPGEPGIAGVTIKLTGTDYAGAAGALTAQTDANGDYRCADLAPGGYSLAETQPAGWLQGKNTVGSLGGQLSGDVFSGIALPPGGQGLHYNCAELSPASLAGFVY